MRFAYVKLHTDAVYHTESNLTGSWAAIFLYWEIGDLASAKSPSVSLVRNLPCNNVVSAICGIGRMQVHIPQYGIHVIAWTGKDHHTV